MSLPLPLKPKKNPIEAFKGGRWVVIVGLVILVGLGVALSRDVVRKTRIKQEVSAMEEEIAQLETRNDELSGLIEYFQSETFKEKEAREKLNVQLPGERVFEVQKPEVNTKENLAANTPEQNLPSTNWGRWWVYLFSKE